MSDKTKIEWTDATWNPIRGCTRVSPGCGGPGPHGGCYAEAVAARFSQPAQGDKPAQPYHGLAEIRGGKPRWTGKVSFGHDLEKPLIWRRPRRIFVNSMSDLFHEELTAEEIATVYAVCVAAHHLNGHTFQILTKRSARMRAILNDPAFWDQVNAEADAMVMERTDPLARRSDDARATLRDYDPETPPPGIWLGVSVEDQERADERIPDLMATPAAVRWISAEPLLRWLDLARIAVRAPGEPAGFHHYLNALTGEIYDDENGTIEEAFGEAQPPRLDWVVVGGESGPRARPMHPDWARVLREQCATANTPFLFKQWGEYNTSSYDMITGNPVYRQFVDFNHWVNKASTWVNGGTCIDRNGRILTNGADFMRARDEGTFPVTIMHRVGKKTAGRQLDGVTHDAFPTEPGALSRNSATAGPPALFTA